MHGYYSENVKAVHEVGPCQQFSQELCIASLHGDVKGAFFQNYYRLEWGFDSLCFQFPKMPFPVFCLFVFFCFVTDLQISSFILHVFFSQDLAHI